MKETEIQRIKRILGPKATKAQILQWYSLENEGFIENEIMQEALYLDSHPQIAAARLQAIPTDYEDNWAAQILAEELEQRVKEENEEEY